MFTLILPDAVQVADPFHMIKPANTKLDECRRRVQNESMGHRGQESDPLYRCRRLLTKAEQVFPSFRNVRFRSLLYAGKPNWDLLTTVRPH